MAELTIERCRYLRDKYPNCYPIILVSGNDEKLTKTKMLVPKDSSFSNLMSQIRVHNKLSSKEAYFIFINNMLINTTDTIENIYMQHKADNGFLYITVKKENAFG